MGVLCNPSRQSPPTHPHNLVRFARVLELPAQDGNGEGSPLADEPRTEALLAWRSPRTPRRVATAQGGRTGARRHDDAVVIIATRGRRGRPADDGVCFHPQPRGLGTNVLTDV